MKQNIEFIKKIRRVEIKEAIENLRAYNKEYEATKKSSRTIRLSDGRKL